MTAIAIVLGFIAAGLVLFGPRISDGIRARRQNDAADEAQAEAFFARVKKPAAPAINIPAQRKEQP